MAQIISRVAKGSPLTHQEMDGNFAALNTELGQKAIADGSNATGTWPVAVTGTASNITGVAAIANGGTGASTVAGARLALNVNNVDNVADTNKPVSGPQQAALDLKAPTASPTFTGNVVVPTLVAGDVSTKATNAAFVAAAITQAKTDLVAGAPANLNTFAELANALGNDIAFATTTSDSLNNRLRFDVATQGLSPAQKANAVTNLGLVASATTDTTNAANISSGYLPVARMPALTGDATAAVGTGALVLAASGVVANAYGSATQVPVITFDAKGRAVSASTALITPAFSSLTGKPTTIAGYGITDDLKLTSAPGAALGIAAVGVAVTAARADHVHALPAVDALSNVTVTGKVSGDTLVWNGVAWVNTAQSAVSSGTASKLSNARNIALTGDATGTVAFDGSANVAIATTLANTAVAAGSYGSASQAVAITVDSKGRVTSASQTAMTPAFANITGKPTTIAGYGITDALQLGATAAANLGTAAAGVATTAARSDHVHDLPTLDQLENVSAATKAAGDTLVNVGGVWTSTAQSALVAGNATKLATPRAIAVSGDIAGTANFDGSAGISIAATLANSGVGAATYGSATQVPVLTVDAKGRVTGASSVAVTPAFANVTGKPTTLGGYGITDAQPALGYTPVNQTALGAVNGVATLDGSGKLTAAQIPAALVGAIVYQGTWNASTNVPALVSGTGVKGQYYKVSADGATALDGQSYWKAGDLAIFDGTTWDRVEGGSTEVTTVAGRVGDVVLVAADIGGLAASATVNTTNAANITSGTLLAARMPALTGDVTSVAGSVAMTLAASGVAAGAYGTAGVIPVITVDAKGRVTNVATANVSIPFTSLTAKPTTAAGYGITDALTTGAAVTIAQGGTGATTALAALTALGGAARANFTLNQQMSLQAVDSRTVANPLTGVGYPGGGRFRFGCANDVDTTTDYADIIDMSTYNDASGGGINSLYFNKGLQKIVHKFAAAGATAWTAKTVAYTDSNITGNAATASSVPFAGITGKPTTLAGYGITDGASTNGMVSLANCISNETPAGAVDGTNTTYALANVPQAMLQVFVNGQLQEPGAGNDFTIAGTTITMLAAIPAGGKIRAFYIK